MRVLITTSRLREYIMTDEIDCAGLLDLLTVLKGAKFVTASTYGMDFKLDIDNSADVDMLILQPNSLRVPKETACTYPVDEDVELDRDLID